MRKALDALYGGALIGSCLAAVLITFLIMLQVTGRVIDRIAVFLGFDRIGFAVPSLAEFSGYLFGIASFLALAATFKSGVHVRVTLALRAFGPRGERVLGVLALAVALGLGSFAAKALVGQTLTTFARGSVSYGMVVIPLWIPQALMTAGIVIFVIAVLDELVILLRGGTPGFRQTELAQEAGISGGH